MLTYLFKSCFLPKTLSDIFLREQKQAEQLLQRHLGGKWPIWLITFLPFGHDGENFYLETNTFIAAKTSSFKKDYCEKQQLHHLKLIHDQIFQRLFPLNLVLKMQSHNTLEFCIEFQKLSLTFNGTFWEYPLGNRKIKGNQGWLCLLN